MANKYIKQIQMPDTSGTPQTYQIRDAEAQAKLATTNIAYGTCSTAAATAEKAVTLTSNDSWQLTEGAVIMVKFSESNSAGTADEPVKLNVNNTGAYPIWYNNAQYTSNSTSYTGYADRVTMYMFDGAYWVWISNSYDSNTTYTNVKLGHGYATCSTAAATTAKVASLSSYTLTTGGIVAVRFTYDVPANATLNINSKGAKSIYYRNAKITDGVIKAGDIATFIYSTYYRLVSIDRWQEDIKALNTEVDAINSEIANHTHTVSHTPAGTVSTPTITVTPNTTTVNSITAVGTLPSLTYTNGTASKITAWSAGSAPSLTYQAVEADNITSWSAGSGSLQETVSSSGPNRTVSLTHVHTAPQLSYTAVAADNITAWSAGSVPSLTSEEVAADDITAWSAGTLPTKGSNTTVVTSIKSATSTQPTFTGTPATLTTSTPND